MSTVTELALFKACVENPQTFKNLADLNLERIADPQDSDSLSEQEYYQKKALKAFHMVWSGTTKYLRTMCIDHGKAVEFPNLGIFNPVVHSDDLETTSKLTSGNLGALDKKNRDIEFHLSQQFINSTGDAIRITDRSGLVKCFDPQNPEDQPLIQNVNHINMASVAKVCDTDVFTVQQIFNEIVAQLRVQIKRGCNIRLAFKIGRLATRNGGEVNWRSFNEEGKLSDTRSRFSTTSTNFSRAMVNSCQRQQLSVFTPSVQKTRTSTIKSEKTNQFHVANPNPQAQSIKFKGVRDIGYKQYEKLIDPTDVIKFGKKVNYESKTTSNQVMEEHLKQMRDKLNNNRNQHEVKRKQERDFLHQVRELENLERSRKLASVKAINEDFVYYNANLQDENEQKREAHRTEQKQDSYNYFPFVSGDVIEGHRQNLAAQLKNDLRSYLDYQKKQSLTKSPQFNMTQKLPSLAGSENISQTTSQFKPLKQLFDSDYVKPDENTRVFQDSHPYKRNTYDGALKRFEDELRSQGKQNSVALQQHDVRINKDCNEINREKGLKIQKQREFRTGIVNQMGQNETARKQLKDTERIPQSTGFTPEIGIGERAALRYKKLEHQKMIKAQLQNQIDQKERNKANEIKAKKDFENMQYQQNTKSLEMMKIRQQEIKNKAKQHWEDELERVKLSVDHPALQQAQ